MPAVLKPATPFPSTPYVNTSLRYTPLYRLLQVINPGDAVVWFNQNNLQSYKATVTSISATQIVLNVPNLPAPTVTINLTPQDLEASLPISLLT